MRAHFNVLACVRLCDEYVRCAILWSVVGALFSIFFGIIILMNANTGY